jgi:hypothetical protein
MTFPGPILAIGTVRHGACPPTGANPKYLVVEVRTPTTRGEFIELEIAQNAAVDLAAKLAEFLDGGRQNTESLEADLDEQAG